MAAIPLGIGTGTAICIGGEDMEEAENEEEGEEDRFGTRGTLRIAPPWFFAYM
jgi:hypothetical protein